MAEIHALRGLTDAVSSLTRQVEGLGLKVDDVRERVIKIEAREYERQIEHQNDRLNAAFKRIDILEAERDRQAGAIGVGAWISKHAPWLVAVVMAGLAALGWKGQA